MAILSCFCLLTFLSYPFLVKKTTNFCELQIFFNTSVFTSVFFNLKNSLFIYITLKSLFSQARSRPLGCMHDRQALCHGLPASPCSNVLLGSFGSVLLHVDSFLHMSIIMDQRTDSLWVIGSHSVILISCIIMFIHVLNLHTVPRSVLGIPRSPTCLLLSRLPIINLAWVNCNLQSCLCLW